MRKIFTSAIVAVALLASATVNHAKAEPIAIGAIIYGTVAALFGGAACAVENQIVGDNLCQGRDNAAWANGANPVPAPGAGYKTDAASKSFVEPGYAKRLGL